MTAQAGDTASSLLRAKARLRRELRAQRQSLSPAQRRTKAQRAARALARAARRWQARHVALYLSLADELDTTLLIEALRRQGCMLYVPVIGRASAMSFAQLAPPFRRNRYGIVEPVLRRAPLRLDLIVLPLVGFDAAGRRLGMGGGYYDRWLATHPRSKLPRRVGYAYAAQEVARVPADARDVPLHAVATETGLRCFPLSPPAGRGPG